MSLTYAGIPLTVPEADLQEQIQAWMDGWTEFEFNDRTWPGAGLEGMTFAQHDWPPSQPKLGTLYWPFTAMKWAVGHFVCSGYELNLIRESLPPFDDTSPPQPAPLVMSTGGAFQTISPEMFLLPPRPINQITGNGNQYYLLTLVDERYHWWYKDCGVFHVIPASTWVDLFSAIALALGVVVNADIVNVNYFFPDPAFTSYYQDLPVLFDAVAYNCGQRVIRGLDGTVSTVNNSSSLAFLNANVLALNNQAAKTLGGSFKRLNDFAYAMPKEVHNVTPIWKSDVPTVLSPLYHVETRRLVEQVGFAGATFGFNGNKTFRDTFHSPEAGAFADEGLLATQVASDYYTRIFNAYLDVTLARTLNVVPDGLHDIEWSYTLAGPSTRIIRSAWNWEPDTLLHGDGNGPFYGNSSNEPWQVQPFFAKTDSTPTGAAYPWSEVIPATGGTFVAKPDNQRTGTAATNPAYEFNGSTTVAANTIILMWRGFQNAAATKQEWLFAVASTGGGSAITVKESDGSPTCTGISTISFNSTYFVVSCDGGGQASVTLLPPPAFITVKESDGDPICTDIDTVIFDASKMTVVCNEDGSATISVKTHTVTVVTDITSVVCNEDGTITVNFDTDDIEVVG